MLTSDHDDAALGLQALRLLGDGALHSSTSLTQRAQVSNERLLRALGQAQVLGAPVQNLARRGWQLTRPIDWLDAERISARLDHGAGRYSVLVEDVVDSTNDELLARALAGAPSGLVLAAELQLRGRGRRGRAWFSGIGGALTFSLLRRFEQGVGTLAGLGLVVSLALVQVLRQAGVGEAMLKWPNDVLWRYQKLAGILIDIQGEVTGPSLAIIGIGINMRLPEAVRQHIDQAATDVASTGSVIERNALLADVLCQLAPLLDRFAESGFSAFREQWHDLHCHAGRECVLSLPDGSTHSGTVVGIGDDGSLLLDDGRGARAFHSGEVSLRIGSPGSGARMLVSGHSG